MTRPPVIALDLVELDGLTRLHGQFRYVVELLQEYAAIGPAARFVVLGGAPAPVPDLAGLFRPGGAWRYEHFPRPLGPGALVTNEVRLAARLAAAGADLVHALKPNTPPVAPCPVVVTVHDTMSELFPEYAELRASRPYRLYKWATRHRARRVVCDSQTTADDVARYWRVPRSRLDVVYLGTRFGGEPAGADAVPGVPADGPVVVSPYHLEPRKNLAALVAAFAAIRRAVPAARLVLYGRAGVQPGREEAFDAQVAAASVGTAVTRTGYVTDAQLNWLHHRATVFAFPSLYEGFGYPVLEAMAAGRCVVARDISAMSEVLGGTGVTVDTADPAALAAAVIGLLRDDARRAAAGRAAREQARRFTVRRMAEGTLASYARALRRPPLTPPAE